MHERLSHGTVFCLQMCAFTMGAPTSREKYGMMAVPTPVNALTACRGNTFAERGTLVFGKSLSATAHV